MCFFDQICKRYKLLVLQGLFSLLITPLYAQQSVGIGTNTPNPRAVLQLVSPGQNQGFLLPKLTTGQITSLGLTLVAADKGLQVYDSLLQQIRYWDGSSWLTLSTSAASGTVTSVGLSLPAIFNVSGSPVTTSGVLSATFLNQAQNTVFAGPTTGSASPTFRTLVAGDIPSLPAAIITSGTLPIARGGTNGTAAPSSGAVAYGTGTAYAFTAAGISGQLLQSTGAGIPIWVNPPATITASNGLTRTVNDIALGGPLIANTSIASSGFNLSYTGTGRFGIGTATPSATFNIDHQSNTSRDAFNMINTRDNVGSATPFYIGGVTAGQTYGVNTFGRLMRLENTTQVALADIGIDGSGRFYITRSGAFDPNTDFAISSTGFVGIGKSAATERLDVAGNFRFSGAIMPNNQPGSSGQVLTSAGPGLPPTWTSAGGSGTVTSVGLSLPGIFSVSGSPITGSGTLTGTLVNQAQNTVFAGPTVGSASPTFRTLVAGDIPSLPATIITSGTLPIARGGTNGTAAPTSGAVAYGTGTAYAFTAAGTSGQLLRSNGAAAPSWVNAPVAGWSLTGNAGTNPLTNFFGSTDPVDVTIRRGAGQSLRLEQFNISQFSNGIDESAIFNVANSDFSHKITLFSGRQNDPNPFILVKLGDPLRFAHDSLGFYEYARFGPTGNFGIGFTSPSQKLDVDGNIKFSGALMPNNVAGTSGQVLTSSGAGLPPTWTNAGAPGWTLTGNAGTNPATNFIGTTDAQPLRFATGVGGVERMRIDATGNVGIGTASPGFNLDIFSTSNALTRIRGTAPAGFSGLVLQNDISNTVEMGINGSTHPILPNALVINQTSNNPIRILTNNTDRIRITGSGNVGIGTTAPQGRLHVANADYNLSPLHMSGSSNTAGTTIRFTHPDPGARTYNIVGSTGSLANMGAGYFGIYDDNSLAYRFTISPAGNTGIGVNAGLSKLHVEDAIPAANQYVIRAINTFTGSADGVAVYGQSTNSTPNYGIGVVGRGNYIGVEALAGTGALAAFRAQGFGADAGHFLGNVQISTGYLELSPIAAPGIVTHRLYNVGGSLFWNGTNISSGGSGWSLTGNAGTNPATNFIGTTDAQPLRFATGVGGVERMRIAANGNVGIGTATPQNSLDVQGSVAIGTYAGINSAFGNSLIVSGSVGIGTSSVNSLAQLRVNSDDTNGARVIFNSSNVTFGNVGLELRSAANSSTTQYIDFANNSTGNNTPDYNFRIDNFNDILNIRKADFSPAISLLQNGNVGIGTGAPEAKLHVAGAVANNLQAHFTQGATDGGFKLTASNGVAGGVGTKQAEFGMLYSGSGYGSSLNFYRGSGATDGSLAINTNGAERVRIDAAGNVGIGTASPSAFAQLHVFAPTGNTRARFETGGGTLGPYISLAHTGGREFLIGSTGSGNGPGANKLDIFDATAGVSRIVVDANGNVGIGTSSPSSPLEIDRVGNNNINFRESGVLRGVVGISGAANQIIVGDTDNDMAIRGDQNILFGIGAAERMRISNAGNVGIGTNSPDQRLVVNGNVRIPDADIFLRPALDQNHGMGWYGGVKTFNSVNVDGPVLYGFSGGGLGTNQNGTRNLALNWNAAGNVGIGTPTPGQKLSVVDAGNTNQFNGTFNVYANNLTQGVGIGYAGVQAVGSNTNQDLSLNAKGAGNITMQVSGTSGNVGIGTTNPSSAKLQVVGTVLANTIYGFSAGGFAQPQGIFFQANAADFSRIRLASLGSGTSHWDIAGFLTGSPATDRLNFWNQGAGIDVLTLSGNGFVGVVTPNPSQRLEVLGNTLTNFGKFMTNRPNASAVTFSGLDLMIDGVTQSGIYTPTGNSMAVYTGGTEKVRIDPNGLVGIGTLSPFYKLHVVNNGQPIYVENTTNTMFSDGMTVRSGSNTTAGTWMIDFRRPDNGQIGIVFQNGANSVSYNTTSDIRLKNILGNSSKGLNDLMSIKIYDYFYKDDPSKKVVVGFAAQELNEVFPQSVTPPRPGSENDPRSNPWMVDFGSLTPLLIKAIQDQQKIIEGLEKRIEQLEGKK